VVIPLADQIACVDRELGYRRRVYPSWVARGRMTQRSADLEIERMEAVRETLIALAGGPAPTLFEAEESA
jgi:hypothetical protein